MSNLISLVFVNTSAGTPSPGQIKINTPTIIFFFAQHVRFADRKLGKEIRKET